MLIIIKKWRKYKRKKNSESRKYMKENTMKTAKDHKNKKLKDEDGEVAFFLYIANPSPNQSTTTNGLILPK